MTKFACFACASPAFTLEGVLSDQTKACCAECGTDLGAWEDVRRKIQAQLIMKDALRRPLSIRSANERDTAARR